LQVIEREGWGKVIFNVEREGNVHCQLDGGRGRAQATKCRVDRRGEGKKKRGGKRFGGGEAVHAKATRVERKNARASTYRGAEINFQGGGKAAGVKNPDEE